MTNLIIITMGFFSFITNDTHESIPNVYSRRETFTVYMMDDSGNVWKEENYEGYGVFGGKDYYELLAEMNGLKTREDGIRLSFSGEKHKCPNLSRSRSWTWVNEETMTCEFQGYFYE